MYSLKIHPFSFFLVYTFTFDFMSQAANFNIRNNCNHTVWAAAVPGGGRLLLQNQNWVVNTDPNFIRGRIWARTNCNFDDEGRGRCESGDCDGALYCVRFGKPPFTLAEYSLNQFQNLDFFDISLVDGFNVPMDFRAASSSTGCTVGTNCTGDINGLCPTELRDAGGCNHPCSVFKNEQFCCATSGREKCGPTAYSKFFKDFCPSVYTYASDDATSTFTCPTGTDYTIVFCP